MTATAFHVFNAQHLVTLCVILALCVLVSWAAKNPSSRKWLGRLIGFALLGYAVCIYAQQVIGRSLNWQYSLPLELCNLVLISCVISLFRPRRFAVEIAYFWGLGGVLQATVTPDLAQGFPSWDFMLFFGGHGATLLAIVFLISGQEFRPSKGSIVRMMLALNVYGLVVGSLDALMGWNYGYLCRKPSGPTLLDFLGPWPWYLLSIEVIAFLTFLLLDLPWHLLVLFRRHGKAVAIDG
jgi:hypothetical integral membrane protein (TIGR02206 family)